MAGGEREIPAALPEALTERVKENARRAFAAVDAAGVARIDSFVKPETEETWVMEINTTPGSFAFYLWEASGMSFTELMDELLDIARTVHAARSELVFSYDSGLLERSRGAKLGG
jgi:D-alanine-D-alanine ligase